MQKVSIQVQKGGIQFQNDAVRFQMSELQFHKSGIQFQKDSMQFQTPKWMPLMANGGFLIQTDLDVDEPFVLVPEVIVFVKKCYVFDVS